MVFFFLIPSIPATLGNFLLPLMIGAKDLAFPKHQPAQLVHLRDRRRASPCTPLVTGGLDTGWTFYTPYSTAVRRRATWCSPRIGIFVAGFSSILTGLNFIVTIHTMRAPGMTWFRMPLFVWAHYATAIIQVLGTPVIAITHPAGRPRAGLPLRLLRPEPRRRPDPVPAPVLVLLAPRRLHHDPARRWG